MYLLCGGFPSTASHPFVKSFLKTGFSQFPALRGIQPEAQWPPTLPSALGQLLGPLSSY